MLAVLNTILNALVRNLHYSIRIIIALAFIALATYALIKSIRKKDDKNPLAYGWFTLCILSMILSVVYFAV